MAKVSLLAGTTSYTTEVFLQDTSSTTGAGLTGLVYNSSGLTCYYYRKGANATVQVTLVTATLGTFTSSGFVEIDATNMPGVYQLGIPNAALASGAKSVIFLLKGATNMAPVVLEIELTAVDNQDPVRGGMTALPNTACTGNASLLTSGTGTDQLSVSSGRVDVGKVAGQAAIAAGAVTFPGSIGTSTYAGGAVASVTGNVGGNVAGSVGSVAGNVAGSVNSVTTGVNLASTGLDSVLMSDVSVVPSITASIKDALNWLFVLARNKRTQTSTTETVFKDNGTTAIGTSTKADDSTTYTRGKYS